MPINNPTPGSVQTLPGAPNTGNLISQLNPSYKKFIPIDVANLIFDLNPAEQVTLDASFANPAINQNDIIQGARDQAGNANDASNGTQANCPLLQLGAFGIGGQPALQFCDSFASPTKGYILGTSTQPLTVAMSTNCTIYVVANMPQVGTEELLNFNGGNAWFGATSGIGVNATVGTNQGGGRTLGASAQLPGNGLGVYAFAYDGATVVARLNNKEIIAADTGSIWGSGGPQYLTIGGKSNDGSTTANSLSKIGRILIYQSVHTKAQRDAICGQLMDVFGINQVSQVVIGGNSIDIGYNASGYTVNWTVHLAFMLGPQYNIANNAVVGQTTSQQANSAVTNALPKSGINATTAGTAAGTPTTTSVAVSGTPWTVNQFAGKTVVFTSGVNSGMGAQIASNTSSTLTLVSPGFAAAPSASDTFSIQSGTTNGQIDVYIAHEITNDAIANGSTDGPSANSGVAATCKLYLRYVTWCRAMRAAGFKVIAVTYTQRSDGAAAYGNFEADRVLMNAAINSNWQIFADAIVDYTVDARFAVYNTGNTWWADGIHPTNAGAKVIGDYMAIAIRSLTGQY